MVRFVSKKLLESSCLLQMKAINMSCTQLSPQTFNALQALVLWDSTLQHIKILPHGLRKQSDLLLGRCKVTFGQYRLATELQSCQQLLEGAL